MATPTFNINESLFHTGNSVYDHLRRNQAVEMLVKEQHSDQQIKASIAIAVPLELAGYTFLGKHVYVRHYPPGQFDRDDRHTRDLNFISVADRSFLIEDSLLHIEA